MTLDGASPTNWLGWAGADYSKGLTDHEDWITGTGPVRRKRTQESAVAPEEQPTPYPTDIPGRPW